MREIYGLWHVTLVHGLHVVFHLVRPRELFGAHRAREHFALMALVVQERVPLEAVFVLERLQYVSLGALQTLVDALGHGRIPKQVEAPDRHFRQLFGRVAGRRGSSPDAPLDWRPQCGRRRRCHRCRRRRCRRLLLLQVMLLLLLHLTLFLVEGGLQLLLVTGRVLGHGQRERRRGQRRELGLVFGGHGC